MGPAGGVVTHRGAPEEEAVSHKQSGCVRNHLLYLRVSYTAETWPDTNLRGKQCVSYSI